MRLLPLMLGALLSACGAQVDQQELDLSLAEVLVEAKAWKSAAPIIRRGLEREPNNPKFHYLLGNMLRESERAYRRALQLDGELAVAHSDLAVLYDLQRKHEDALRHHLRAIKISPSSARFQHNYAFSLHLQGRFEDAVSHYEMALQSAPAEERIYVNLAFSLGALHRDGEARSALEEVLSAAQVLNNLGLSHELRGEEEAALRLYRAAFEKDRQLEEAQTNWARLRRTRRAASTQGSRDAAQISQTRGRRSIPSTPTRSVNGSQPPPAPLKAIEPATSERSSSESEPTASSDTNRRPAKRAATMTSPRGPSQAPRQGAAITIEIPPTSSP